MKKSLSMLAIIFIGWMYLLAIPQHCIRSMYPRIKKVSFAVD
jgi:hypothetical protein